MKLRAQVIAVRHQDARIGQEHDRRVVTLQIYHGGTIEIELLKHEAAAYPLERWVDVELKPERVR